MYKIVKIDPKDGSYEKLDNRFKTLHETCMYLHASGLYHVVGDVYMDLPNQIMYHILRPNRRMRKKKGDLPYTTL